MKMYSVLLIPRTAKIFIGILMCCSILQSTAQDKNAHEKKDRHFTVYGGIGPSYYFNNLVVGKQGVNELGYSVVGRFMWEPEYFLSLGVETGYFR
ncbi:MAG TPA: hypothetical protein VGQ59_11185, partial [Cyclobacteriaceae bacterium]|nr:hypothetical protein [Cyclobacteriaceae bacterium]